MRKRVVELNYLITDKTSDDFEESLITIIDRQSWFREGKPSIDIALKY